MFDILIKIVGRYVFVVIRGSSFKKDIKVIKGYIIEIKLVVIVVDGAVDVLFEEKIRLNIIIGDMDSVFEESFYKCDEIIVYLYLNGYVSGFKRI